MKVNVVISLPQCPITGEFKPHRNAMGVSTYNVRVLGVAAIAAIMDKRRRVSV